MSGLRIGSLCTGYGGLDMAVQTVFGGALAWVADDPGASRILAHHHPDVPNLGDVTAVDWHDLEPVDVVVVGGYPCQPFSTAGKRKGVHDARHLWPHIARALGVLRPRYAVFENVAGHLRLGFDTVLADLARLGFDAEWCLVRASEVGAPHQRQRLFLLATAADTADLGHERGRGARRRGHGPADHGHAPAHAERLVPGHHGQLSAGRDAVRQYATRDGQRERLYLTADLRAERWPTPEEAYALALSIISEVGWTASTAADKPFGKGLGREFWLRKAALLDRIALGDESERVRSDAAEMAIEAARRLMDTDDTAVICDPRAYVRQQYERWLKQK